MSVLPVGISGEAGEYQIERSLRFNSADSAYLNRTPSGAGTSATIWTFSWWQKGVALTGSTQVVFGAESGGSRDMIRWDGNGSLEFVKATSTVIRVPTAKYRDPSAWYHFIINVSGATVGVYVNGVQVTAFSTSNNPSGSWLIGQANLHRIGLDPTGGDALNGYLTEIHMIDGQALDPTSFGEFNSDTGVWQPKAYTGSYGTNGFYLDFSDNSGTTSTTLGADSSGNGNNWTPNNFSVTAGAGNDSLVDSPTRYGTDTGAGGEVRGNYCTLNPLNSAGATLSNGNLDCVTAVSGGDGGRGTIAVTSGKWYWEFTPTNNGNQSFSGIALTTTASASYYVAYYANTGNKFVIGSGSSAYGATYTDNDVIGVALDLDSGTKTVTFYKNNVSQGAITITPSEPVLPIVDDGSGAAATTFNCNFGQRPFAYTAPSGFKALVTTNLPEPTIADGSQYFDAALYTGNQGTNVSVTSLAFQPDLVWGKNRSSISNHWLFDSVRGATKMLQSDQSVVEETQSGVTSFNSDGFTLGTWIGSTKTNDSYVAWNWKANGAGVSNTAGTITSTVSVNTTSGFSIVTYTGTGNNATVGHGIGVAPSMVIVKLRSGGANWMIWHRSLNLTDNQFLEFNSNSVQSSGAAVWDVSEFSSSVIGLGSNGDSNGSGSTYVAYCFAQIPGYSAFGSYTGNGSTDGPMIFTGFRPAFIIVKSSSAVGNWQMLDTARNPANAADKFLRANSSIAEATNYPVDILSNGFKMRNTDSDYQSNGTTYIYMAFAENPFAYSLAR